MRKATVGSPTAPGSASMHQRVFVLGLVGGIGSGKSFVAKVFRDLGCLVIDFDREAKAALDRPEVCEQIAEWWGKGVLSEDGSVSRSCVARVVFHSPADRRKLERLIHPIVYRTKSRAAQEAIEAGAAGAVLDAPLLFEAGMEAECDATAFVEAPLEVRLARVQRGRGWDAVELARREDSQMPIEDKRSRCRFVIENTGDLEKTAQQVREVFDTLCVDEPDAAC